MGGLFITPQQNRFYRGLCAVLACILSVSLILTPSASYAQSINLLNLPLPGTMVALSPVFAPVLLKGLTIHPDDPLSFDFIIDSGNTGFTTKEVEKESERLVKYFLASMTVPKDDLWVNLSPYESDRIIPEELGKTELGRDMLAQDYILKQLTASFMYPEKELGKKFWDRIYARAEKEFGTSEIPVNTFNKVWILPDSATVYEYEQTVYVVDARLKVMLDSDYVAMEAQQADTATPRASAKGQDNGVILNEAEGRVKDLNSPDSSHPIVQQQGAQNDGSLSAEIIREIILPEIEYEVNHGKNFAPLRQIYHSLILAKWYKETVKNSLLSQVYADKNLIAGVDTDDRAIKEKIYDRYMEAYKKGVFNYIKEDYDKLSDEIIPRKYFSGGLVIGAGDIYRTSSPVKESQNPQYRASVEVTPQKTGSSSPILIPFTVPWYINRLGMKQGILRAVLSVHDAETVRYEAAMKLGEKGDARATIPLINALADDSPSVRWASAGALGKIGDRRAEKPLTERLSDPSRDVRIAAIHALVKLIGKDAVDFFIEKLSDPDSKVRIEVIKLLVELEDTRAVIPLTEKLSDPSDAVRIEVIHALAEFEDKRAADPLFGISDHPSIYIRSLVADALERLGDNRSKALLRRIDYDRRLQSLREIKNGEDVDSLESAWKYRVEKLKERMLQERADDILAELIDIASGMASMHYVYKLDQAEGVSLGSGGEVTTYTYDVRVPTEQLANNQNKELLESVIREIQNFYSSFPADDQSNPPTDTSSQVREGEDRASSPVNYVIRRTSGRAMSRQIGSMSVRELYTELSEILPMLSSASVQDDTTDLEAARVRIISRLHEMGQSSERIFQKTGYLEYKSMSMDNFLEAVVTTFRGVPEAVDILMSRYGEILEGTPQEKEFVIGLLRLKLFMTDQVMLPLLAQRDVRKFEKTMDRAIRIVREYHDFDADVQGDHLRINPPSSSSSPVMAQADFIEHLKGLQGIVVGQTKAGQNISLRDRIVEYMVWAKNTLRMSIMDFEKWKKAREETRTFDPRTGFSSGIGVSAVHRLPDGSDVKNDLLVLYKMLRDAMEESEELREALVLNDPEYWHLAVQGLDTRRPNSSMQAMLAARQVLLGWVSAAAREGRPFSVGYDRDVTLTDMMQISLQGYPLDNNLTALRDGLTDAAAGYREGVEEVKSNKGYQITIGTFRREKMPYIAYSYARDAIKEWKAQGEAYQKAYNAIHGTRKSQGTIAGILPVQEVNLVYHENDSLSQTFAPTTSFTLSASSPVRVGDDRVSSPKMADNALSVGFKLSEEHRSRFQEKFTTLVDAIFLDFNDGNSLKTTDVRAIERHLKEYEGGKYSGAVEELSNIIAQHRGYKTDDEFIRDKVRKAKDHTLSVLAAYFQLLAADPAKLERPNGSLRSRIFRLFSTTSEDRRIKRNIQWMNEAAGRDVKKWIALCLLQDIGRIVEAKEGTVQHEDAGYELLLNNDLLGGVRLDQRETALLIKHHIDPHLALISAEYSYGYWEQREANRTVESRGLDQKQFLSDLALLWLLDTAGVVDVLGNDGYLDNNRVETARGFAEDYDGTVARLRNESALPRISKLISYNDANRDKHMNESMGVNRYADKIVEARDVLPYAAYFRDYSWEQFEQNFRRLVFRHAGFILPALAWTDPRVHEMGKRGQEREMAKRLGVEIQDKINPNVIKLVVLLSKLAAGGNTSAGSVEIMFGDKDGMTVDRRKIMVSRDLEYNGYASKLNKVLYLARSIRKREQSDSWAFVDEFGNEINGVEIVHDESGSTERTKLYRLEISFDESDFEDLNHGVIMTDGERAALKAEYLKEGGLSAREFVNRIRGKLDRNQLMPLSQHFRVSKDYEYRLGGYILGDKEDGKGAIIKINERFVREGIKEGPVQDKALETLDALRDIDAIDDYSRYEMIYLIGEIIRTLAEEVDYDRAEKQAMREYALGELSPIAGSFYEGSQDPLKTAVYLSAMANALDTTVLKGGEQIGAKTGMMGPIEKQLGENEEKFWSQEEAGNNYAKIKEKIDSNEKKTVIFAFDNAGEDIFDLMLIRHILRQGHRVILVGKSAPIGNDTTEMDIEEMFNNDRVRQFLVDADGSSLLDIDEDGGLRKDGTVRIIGSGSLVAGLDLLTLSKEFQNALVNADMIIFKGQANYFTTFNVDLGIDTFYVLRVKNDEEVFNRHKARSNVMEYKVNPKGAGSHGVGLTGAASSPVREGKGLVKEVRLTKVVSGLHTTTGSRQFGKALAGQDMGYVVRFLTDLAGKLIKGGIIPVLDNKEAFMRTREASPDAAVGYFIHDAADEAEEALAAGARLLIGVDDGAGPLSPELIESIKSRYPKAVVITAVDTNINGLEDYLRMAVAAGVDGIQLKPFKNVVINDATYESLRPEFARIISELRIMQKDLLIMGAGGIFGEKLTNVIKLPQDIVSAMGFMDPDPLDLDGYSKVFERAVELNRQMIAAAKVVGYEGSVREVFRQKEQELQGVLSEEAGPEKYKESIRKNQDSKGKALFINAPLGHDAQLRQQYADAQEIVARHLGGDLIEGKDYAIREQIHLTAANMEIAEKEGSELHRTLEDVFDEARQDAKARGAEPFVIKLIGPRLMPNSVVVMEYEILDPGFLAIRQAADQRIADYREDQIGDNRAFAPNIYHSTVATITDPNVTKATLRDLADALDRSREEVSAKEITATVSRIQVSEYSLEDRKILRSLPYDLPVTASSPVTDESGPVNLPVVNEWYTEGESIQHPFKNGLADIPIDHGGRISVRSVLEIFRNIEREHGWEPGTIAIEGGAVRRLLSGEYLLTEDADVDLLIRLPQIDQAGKAFGREVLEALKQSFHGTESVRDVDSSQEEWIWRGIKLDYVGYYDQESLEVYYKGDLFAHIVEPIAEMWIDTEARVYSPHDGVKDLFIDKIARIRGRVRSDIDPSEDFRNFIMPHNVLRVIRFVFEYGLQFDEASQEIAENIYKDRQRFNVPAWQWEWIDFADEFRGMLGSHDFDGERILARFEEFIEDNAWPKKAGQKEKSIADLKEALEGGDFERAWTVFDKTAPFWFYRDDGRKIISRAADYPTAVRARQYLAAIGFEENIAKKIGMDLDAILNERPDASSSPVTDAPGGIDLNDISVERQGGASVNIQFDPAEVQQIIDMGIDGFAPIIINIVPLPSVLPLLGLAPQREEEEVELSMRQ